MSYILTLHAHFEGHKIILSISSLPTMCKSINLPKSLQLLPRSTKEETNASDQACIH